MAELTVEAARRHGMPLQDKEGLVAALDEALEGASIWIDPAFYDRPADHPIVDAVKPQFHEWLMELGLNHAEATSVNHRLGAYFTFALRHEWAEHAEYAPLEAEFQKCDNRFAKADARERAWIRNADYLQRLIREPVFDEAFGLQQIYVPLRAWYRDAPVKSSRRGRIPDESSVEEAPQIVVDLERYLDEWLEKGEKKDAIRVVCGGPGSGKTSSTKVWAAKLALAGRRVLYVPLHHLDIRGDAPDVQAMLWEYLLDLNVLPSDPLDAKEGESELLILFDGVDELVMQGRAGQEVARSFIEAVANKIDRLNERDDRLIRAVLGGRDVVVDAARIADNRVLHVLGYHTGYTDVFKDPEKLLEKKEYGCDRWWEQFGKATGDGYTSLPEPLKQQALADVTAQPLLNYLLALSYRRGKLDFSTAPNPNLIYRDLLDAVYERPWGPAAHPTQKVLSREEFHQLLDELGLAAWHGAGRTFTETQAEQACQQAGLSDQLSTFREGARAGAISLLAACYFRQARRIEGERTFEFSHKSFGEYLTARRLIRQVDDIHEERTRNRANRQRGWSEEQALIRWVEFTGPTALDHALLAFLQREVELKDDGRAKEWQRTFVELFSDQLQHGLPMHRLLDRLRPSTFQEMTRQARNAEEALLAVLYCCASVTKQPLAVNWPSKKALACLLTRLEQEQSLATQLLGWLEASGQNLYWASLLFGNLSGINLAASTLFGAGLFRAELSGATLVGATLIRADIEGANLAGADLAGAILSEAVLYNANLRSANLEGAELRDANLQSADLAGANLTGSNLEAANLVDANLHDVRGLDDVKSWRGAKIECTWVKRLGLDDEKLGLVVVNDLPNDNPEREQP